MGAGHLGVLVLDIAQILKLEAVNLIGVDLGIACYGRVPRALAGTLLLLGRWAARAVHGGVGCGLGAKLLNDEF